jgi:isoquinoline 1-oxidoreductase subunit alpha
MVIFSLATVEGVGMSIGFKINGKPVTIDDTGEMPLLWAIRDDLKLTGTKFGCGIGACGACTVMVDGVAIRSCVTAVASVAGANITTIEGLAPADTPSAVQAAWIAQQVPQCGYCQSGMIMAATSLLASNANPTDADIDDAMTNICRCGTYPRIRRAIKQAAAAGNGAPTTKGEA